MGSPSPSAPSVLTVLKHFDLKTLARLWTDRDKVEVYYLRAIEILQTTQEGRALLEDVKTYLASVYPTK